jgi:hypothetical protein
MLILGNLYDNYVMLTNKLFIKKLRLNALKDQI